MVFLTSVRHQNNVIFPEEVFGLPLNKGSVTIVPTLVNSPRPRLGVGRGGGGLVGGARRGRPPMAVQYATGGLITKGGLGTAGRLSGKRHTTPQAVLNKSVVITPAQRTGGAAGRGIVTKGLKDIQLRPKPQISSPKAGPAPILGKIVKKIEKKEERESDDVVEAISTTSQATTTSTTTTDTTTTDLATPTGKASPVETLSDEKIEEITEEVASQTHSEVVLGQPSRTAVGFTRDTPQLAGLTGDARTGIVKPQVQARAEAVRDTQKTQPQNTTTTAAQSRPTASLTPLQSISNLLPQSTAVTSGYTQTQGYTQTPQPLFQPFLQPQNTAGTSNTSLASNVAQVAPQIHPTVTTSPVSSPITSAAGNFSYATANMDQNAVSRGTDSPLNLSQLLEGQPAGNPVSNSGNSEEISHHSALEYLNYTLSQSSSAFRRPEYPTGLSADLQSLLNSAQQPITSGNPAPASFPSYQAPYQYGANYRPTTSPYSYPAQYPHYPAQYPLSPAPPAQSMGQYGGLHPSPTPPYNSYPTPPPPAPPHARPPYASIGSFAHGPYPPM
ncbi:hypothetical protein E2C01_036638 [Portunus trituberculatus]|uniref:Uncharacterized protein n=1 Tax=Portunus trituberculatus TaxID=210409 RepID=A0A5B7FD09_PORTR|nr:hypothetical protein [Portunus trituberculatus]